MPSNFRLLPLAVLAASPAWAAGGSVAGNVKAGADSPFSWVVYVERAPSLSAAPASAPRKEIVQQDIKFKPEVASDGSYQIKDIPPGKYTLVAWSPRHQPARQEVRIEAGRQTAASFSLKARPFPERHMNKNGEPYGRYK